VLLFDLKFPVANLRQLPQELQIGWHQSVMIDIEAKKPGSSRLFAALPQTSKNTKTQVASLARLGSLARFGR